MAGWGCDCGCGCVALWHLTPCVTMTVPCATRQVLNAYYTFCGDHSPNHVYLVYVVLGRVVRRCVSTHLTPGIVGVGTVCQCGAAASVPVPRAR